MRSGFLHRAASALARRTIGGYPQPWRERYEAEVLTLLEDSPARLRDVVDLGRGLLVERARALFEPGDRPELTATLVSLAGFARANVIAAPPILAGWAARYWLEPAPRAVARFAMLMSLGLMGMFVTLRLVMSAIRRRWPSASSAFPFKQRKAFSGWAGHIWLGLVIPMAFLMSWSSNHIIQGLGCLYWFYPVWDRIAARRAWQDEMARAVQQLRAARGEIEWAARMELERCEDLVKQGLPAPLQEARDALAHLERDKEEALATLHGFGYRASLRTSRTPNPEPLEP